MAPDLSLVEADGKCQLIVGRSLKDRWVQHPTHTEQRNGPGMNVPLVSAGRA